MTLPRYIKNIVMESESTIVKFFEHTIQIHLFIYELYTCTSVLVNYVHCKTYTKQKLKKADKDEIIAI